MKKPRKKTRKRKDLNPHLAHHLLPHPIRNQGLLLLLIINTKNIHHFLIGEDVMKAVTVTAIVTRKETEMIKEEEEIKATIKGIAGTENGVEVDLEC